MTKGILLSAWGKRGYIYAAYNLAFSLKHYNRMIPVTLYCDERLLSQLMHDQKDIFDQIIPIPDELLSQPPAYIKVSAYDHLPYDYTLVLDVDALAMQDIEPALDDMIQQGGSYYSHILNLHNISQGNDIPDMFWATADVIWEKYNLPHDAILPCTNSSFQFFKKSGTAKLIDQIKKNLNDPIPLERLKNQWGASQPDELYLNIALAQLGLTGKPERDYMFMGANLSPKPLHIIQKEYFILSVFGGHRFTKARYTEFYDRLYIKMCYAHGNHAYYKFRDIVRDKHANTRPIKFTPERAARDARMNGTLQKIHSGKSNEKIVFYSGWFKHTSEKRQVELDKCLLNNLNNPEISQVVIITESDCEIKHEKLIVNQTLSRPTFNDFVRVINDTTEDDTISVLANGDIYIDQSNAKKLRQINYTGRALALSRWEEDVNGFKKHFNYEWSQDAWVIKGKVKDLNCEAYMGTMQCDGRFAYELKQAGYDVVNPSKDIQFLHVHKSGKRDYDVNAQYKEPKHPVYTCNMNNYVKKRLLIIQPGKVGDILICSPIAKHYSSEYFVDWECPKKYHSLFDSIPYAQPIEKANEKEYQAVKDLSFGLGGKPEKWWQQNKSKFNSFVEAKYELAGLPVQMKGLIEWVRNETREKELFKKVVGTVKKYALVHDSSDYGTPSEIETELKIVKFSPVEDYTIFDWYQVIQKASEIHCIDSSLCNFIDMISPVKAKLFYCKTDRTPNQWDETLLNKNWIRNEVSVSN